MSYTSNSEFDAETRVQITNELPLLDMSKQLNSVLRNDTWKWLLGYENITWDTPYESTTTKDQNGNSFTTENSAKIVNGTQADDYGPQPYKKWNADTDTYDTIEPTFHRMELNGALLPESDLFLHEIYRYLGVLFPNHPDWLELLTHDEIIDAFENAAAIVDYKPNNNFFDIVASSIEAADEDAQEVESFKIALRNLKDNSTRRKLYGSSSGYKMYSGGVFEIASCFPMGTYLPRQPKQLDYYEWENYSNIKDAYNFVEDSITSIEAAQSANDDAKDDYDKYYSFISNLLTSTYTTLVNDLAAINTSLTAYLTNYDDISYENAVALSKTFYKDLTAAYEDSSSDTILIRVKNVISTFIDDISTYVDTISALISDAGALNSSVAILDTLRTDDDYSDISSKITIPTATKSTVLAVLEALVNTTGDENLYALYTKASAYKNRDVSDDLIDKFDPNYQKKFRLIDWTNDSRNIESTTNTAIDFSGIVVPGNEYEIDEAFSTDTTSSDAITDDLSIGMIIDNANETEDESNYVSTVNNDKNASVSKITTLSSSTSEYESGVKNYISQKVYGVVTTNKNIVSYNNLYAWNFNPYKLLSSATSNSEKQSFSNVVQSAESSGLTFTNRMTNDGTFFNGLINSFKTATPTEDNADDISTFTFTSDQKKIFRNTVSAIYNPYVQNTFVMQPSEMIKLYESEDLPTAVYNSNTATFSYELNSNVPANLSVQKGQYITSSDLMDDASSGTESIYQTSGISKGSIDIKGVVDLDETIYANVANYGSFNTSDNSIVSNPVYGFVVKNSDNKYIVMMGTMQITWGTTSGNNYRPSTVHFNITHIPESIPTDVLSLIKSNVDSDYEDTTNRSLVYKDISYVDGEGNAATYEGSTINQNSQVVMYFKRTPHYTSNGISYAYSTVNFLVEKGLVDYFSLGNISLMPVSIDSEIANQVFVDATDNSTLSAYEDVSYTIDSQSIVFKTIKSSILNALQSYQAYSYMDTSFKEAFIDGNNVYAAKEQELTNVEIQCVIDTSNNSSDTAAYTLSFESDTARERFKTLSVGDEVYGAGLSDDTKIVALDNFTATVNNALPNSGTFILTFACKMVCVPDDNSDDLFNYKKLLYDRGLYNQADPFDNGFYGSDDWPYVSNAVVDGTLNVDFWKPYTDTASDSFFNIVNTLYDDKRYSYDDDDNLVYNKDSVLLPSVVKFDNSSFIEYNLRRLINIKNKTNSTTNLMNVEWLDYMQGSIDELAKVTDEVSVGTNLIMQTDRSGYYTLISGQKYTDPQVHTKFMTVNWDDDTVPAYAQIGSAGEGRAKWFKSIDNIATPNVYGVSVFDKTQQITESDTDIGEMGGRSVYADKDSNTGISGIVQNEIKQADGVEDLIFEVPIGEYEIQKDYTVSNNTATTVALSFYKQTFNNITKQLSDPDEKLRFNNDSVSSNESLMSVNDDIFSFPILDNATAYTDNVQFYYVDTWTPAVSDSTINYPEITNTLKEMYDKNGEADSSYQPIIPYYAIPAGDKVCLNDAESTVVDFPDYSILMLHKDSSGNYEWKNLSFVCGGCYGKIPYKSADDDASKAYEEHCNSTYYKSGSNITYLNFTDALTYHLNWIVGKSGTIEDDSEVESGEISTLHAAGLRALIDDASTQLDLAYSQYADYENKIFVMDYFKGLYTTADSYFTDNQLIAMVPVTVGGVDTYRVAKIKKSSFIAAIDFQPEGSIQTDEYLAFAGQSTLYSGSDKSELPTSYFQYNSYVASEFTLPRRCLTEGKYRFNYTLDPKFMSTGYRYDDYYAYVVEDGDKPTDVVTFNISKSPIYYDSTYDFFYMTTDLYVDGEVSEENVKVVVKFNEQKFFKNIKYLSGTYQIEESQNELSTEVYDTAVLTSIDGEDFTINDLSQQDTILQIQENYLRSNYASSLESTFFSNYTTLSGAVYGIELKDNAAALYIAGIKKSQYTYTIGRLNFVSEIEKLYPCTLASDGTVATTYEIEEYADAIADANIPVNDAPLLKNAGIKKSFFGDSINEDEQDVDFKYYKNLLVFEGFVETSNPSQIITDGSTQFEAALTKLTKNDTLTAIVSINSSTSSLKTVSYTLDSDSALRTAKMAYGDETLVAALDNGQIYYAAVTDLSSISSLTFTASALDVLSDASSILNIQYTGSEWIETIETSGSNTIYKLDNDFGTREQIFNGSQGTTDLTKVVIYDNGEGKEVYTSNLAFTDISTDTVYMYKADDTTAEFYLDSDKVKPAEVVVEMLVDSTAFTNATVGTTTQVSYYKITEGPYEITNTDGVNTKEIYKCGADGTQILINNNYMFAYTNIQCTDNTLTSAKHWTYGKIPYLSDITMLTLKSMGDDEAYSTTKEVLDSTVDSLSSINSVYNVLNSIDVLTKAEFNAKYSQQYKFITYISLPINDSNEIDLTGTQTSHGFEPTDNGYYYYLSYLLRYACGFTYKDNLLSDAISDVIVTSNNIIVQLTNGVFLTINKSYIVSNSIISYSWYGHTNWTTAEMPSGTRYATTSSEAAAISVNDSGTSATYTIPTTCDLASTFVIDNVYVKNDIIYAGGYFKSLSSITDLDSTETLPYLKSNCLSPAMFCSLDQGETFKYVDLGYSATSDSKVNSLLCLDSKLIALITYTDNSNISYSYIDLTGGVPTSIGDDSSSETGITDGYIVADHIEATTYNSYTNCIQTSANGSELIYSTSNLIMYFMSQGELEVPSSPDNAVSSISTVNGVITLTGNLMEADDEDDSTVERVLVAFNTSEQITDQTPYINYNHLDDISANGQLKVATVVQVSDYHTADKMYSYRETLITSYTKNDDGTYTSTGQELNYGYPAMCEDDDYKYYEYTSTEDSAGTITKTIKPFTNDNDTPLYLCTADGTQTELTIALDPDTRKTLYYKSLYDLVKDTASGISLAEAGEPVIKSLSDSDIDPEYMLEDNTLTSFINSSSRKLTALYANIALYRTEDDEWNDGDSSDSETLEASGPYVKISMGTQQSVLDNANIRKYLMYAGECNSYEDYGDGDDGDEDATDNDYIDFDDTTDSTPDIDYLEDIYAYIQATEGKYGSYLNNIDTTINDRFIAKPLSWTENGSTHTSLFIYDTRYHIFPFRRIRYIYTDLNMPYTFVEGTKVYSNQNFTFESTDDTTESNVLYSALPITSIYLNPAGYGGRRSATTWGTKQSDGSYELLPWESDNQAFNTSVLLKNNADDYITLCDDEGNALSFVNGIRMLAAGESTSVVYDDFLDSETKEIALTSNGVTTAEQLYRLENEDYNAVFTSTKISLSRLNAFKDLTFAHFYRDGVDFVPTSATCSDLDATFIVTSDHILKAATIPTGISASSFTLTFTFNDGGTVTQEFEFEDVPLHLDTDLTCQYYNNDLTQVVAIGGTQTLKFTYDDTSATVAAVAASGNLSYVSSSTTDGVLSVLVYVNSTYVEGNSALTITYNGNDYIYNIPLVLQSKITSVTKNYSTQYFIGDRLATLVVASHVDSAIALSGYMTCIESCVYTSLSDNTLTQQSITLSYTSDTLVDGIRGVTYLYKPLYKNFKTLVSKKGVMIPIEGHTITTMPTFNTISESDSKITFNDSLVMPDNASFNWNDGNEHYLKLKILTVAPITLATSLMNNSDYYVEIDSSQIDLYPPDRCYFNEAGLPLPPVTLANKIYRSENNYAYYTDLFLNGSNDFIYECNEDGKYIGYTLKNGALSSYDLGDDDGDCSANVYYNNDERFCPQKPVYNTCKDWYKDKFYIAGKEINPFWQVLQVTSTWDANINKFVQTAKMYQYGKATSKLTFTEVDDDEVYCSVSKATVKKVYTNYVKTIPNYDYVDLTYGVIRFVLGQPASKWKTLTSGTEYGLSYVSNLHNSAVWAAGSQTVDDFNSYITCSYTVNSFEDAANPQNKDYAIADVTELALLDKDRNIIAYAVFPPIEYRTDKQHVSFTCVINNSNLTPSDS